MEKIFIALAVGGFIALLFALLRLLLARKRRKRWEAAAPEIKWAPKL